MAIREDILEELLKDCKKPEDLMGKNGLLKELTKRLIEKALQGELTHHLGYEKHGRSDETNSRNGTSSKGIKTREGEEIDIRVPRDRKSSFEPQMVKKHERRFDGFDDKIISMYARGMTVRDIQGHLMDMYGTEVSPEFISSVTDAVVEDVRAWQNRPLENIYPIVYLDAIFVKVRDNGHIINKAVYFALGVTMEGMKDLLGMWIAETEGSKFWLSVVTEIKNRGVQDIFIACIDGLKGFPEAIETVFGQTQIQVCIVHMVRNSLKYVSWKDRKSVAADLRTIYSSVNEGAARESLEEFEAKWNEKYSRIGELWRRHWSLIIPFLAYPKDIRRAIYTTNAIESLNHSLRKVTKNRGAFPNDEAVFKLLYLAMRNAARNWTKPIHNWPQALNQFAIVFADRFPKGI